MPSHTLKPDELKHIWDSRKGYLAAHAFALIPFIKLYVSCKPHLQPAFCALVLKGGCCCCALSLITSIVNFTLFGFGGVFTDSSRLVFWVLMSFADLCGKLACLLLMVKYRSPLNTEPVPPGYFVYTNARELFTYAVALGIGYQGWYNILIFSTMLKLRLEQTVFGLVSKGINSLLVPTILLCCCSMACWENSLKHGNRPTVSQFARAVSLPALLSAGLTFASANITYFGVTLSLSAIAICYCLMILYCWYLTRGMDAF